MTFYGVTKIIKEPGFQRDDIGDTNIKNIFMPSSNLH